MCGILCLIDNCREHEDALVLEQFRPFKESIARRGPNSMKTEIYTLESCKLLMSASVLWLQGKFLKEQPVIREKKVLIYNGDIFGGFAINHLHKDMCDTELLFEALTHSDDVHHTIESLEGPYAFIYLDISENILYFARDKFGRRSLLVGRDENQVIIASVAKKNVNFKFMELPAIGTFSLNLCTMEWSCWRWTKNNYNFNDKIQELEAFLGQKIYKHANDNSSHCKDFVDPKEVDFQFLSTVHETPFDEIFTFLCNSHWLPNISKLHNLLESSIKKRIAYQPKFCQNCVGRSHCAHCRLGVLFSGGVDCTILALLASKFESGSIDLINVSFENKGGYNTPDRITALESYKELQELCPHTDWNLLEVNVSTEELDLCRSQYISDLIYPLNTILDDSLGCALWFASRAEKEGYRSPCRILLVGMGADELFGGYSRHRNAFQRMSWQGLHNSLEEDFGNLPYRNLGRDDRVVSDHGRQLRTPYLDENVVEFVTSLNSWEKSIPSKHLPQGVGEKILLRSLAYHLGLKNASKFKKRALQFGSRIASPKEKAHEISVRL